MARLRPALIPRVLLATALAGLLAACVAPSGVPPGEVSAPVPIKLIAFNDFHGHLLAQEGGELTLPHPERPGERLTLPVGGAAHLATLVRQARETQANTLVVSTGDLIGGSRLTSALFRDEPTIEVMNRIGLDVNVVGNHEFDRGRAELARLIQGGCARGGNEPLLRSCEGPQPGYEGARFAFLAANVVDEDGRPLHPPYLIRRFGGVRIGLIGVVTRTTPSLVSAAGIAGLRFEDEADTLNRYAQVLRAQGVRAIVAVVHEGGLADPRDTDGPCERARGEIFPIVDRLSEEIDLVLSGHTHQAYNCLRGATRVVQAGAFGRLVTEIDLMVDPRDGDVVRGSVRAVTRPVVRAGAGIVPESLPVSWRPLPADRVVDDWVGHYARRAEPIVSGPVARIGGPFTRVPSPGGDSAAGRLIADAQLAATRDPAKGGAQIALMNPGGIRADLVPRDALGTVSLGEVFRVQPFGNTLVTMSLTGAQLREVLEDQWRGVNAGTPRLLQTSRGFGYAWRADAPEGRRIVEGSMTLDGRPIEPGASYRVTANSFLADGGDGFRGFTQGVRRTGSMLDLDALIAWLRERAPAAPDPTPRLRRLP